jgi:hypothetical protein
MPPSPRAAPVRSHPRCGVRPPRLACPGPRDNRTLGAPHEQVKGGRCEPATRETMPPRQRNDPRRRVAGSAKRCTSVLMNRPQWRSRLLLGGQHPVLRRRGGARCPARPWLQGPVIDARGGVSATPRGRCRWSVLTSMRQYGAMWEFTATRLVPLPRPVGAGSPVLLASRPRPGLGAASRRQAPWA